MRLTGVGLLLSSGVTLVAQAPPARPPASSSAPAVTYTVSGRISDSTTGDPIRHARVGVTSSAGSSATLTDGDGRYLVDQLPAGRLTVSVSKPGFVQYSTASETGANRRNVSVDAALVRGGIIAGTLMNDRGEPAVDASVLVSRIETGPPPLKTRAVAIGQTDDLGAFRVAGLAQGAYVLETRPGLTLFLDGSGIGVESRGAQMFGGPRFYYPGVRDLADAQRIVIGSGDEQVGLAFVVPDAPGPPPSPPPPEDVMSGRHPVAVVRGRVFKPEGLPARGVRVAVYGVDAGRPVIGTVTDSFGRFTATVRDPEADTFRVMASLEWFGVRFYGQTSSERRGEIVRLRAGELREGLDITFIRPSVISGRVVDDLGEPVEGAAVRTSMVRYIRGRKQIIEGAGVRRTDDQGRFRLFGLRPGTFAVSATVAQVVRSESAVDYPGYGRTYYPGTSMAVEAQFVRVGAAEEIPDINFSLVRTRSYRISGVAVDAAGNPVSGGISLLPTDRSGGDTGQQFGARIERDGRFEFTGLLPGDYVIQVARNHRNTGNEGEFTYQFVTVRAADIDGLHLRTSTGSTIRGHLTVVGAAPDAFDVANVELVAVPADLDRAPRAFGPAARAEIQDDRSFSLQGISGPRRLQVKRAPDGWMMKAVIAGGIDVTDRVLEFGRPAQSLDEVEVVMTDQVTELSGRVNERQGLGTADISVLAFTTNRDAWYLETRYVQSVRLKTDGSFSIAGLPPGEYFVRAIETPSDPGEWENADVLEQVSSRAIRVRLSEGQHETVTLGVRR